MWTMLDLQNLNSLLELHRLLKKLPQFRNGPKKIPCFQGQLDILIELFIIIVTGLTNKKIPKCIQANCP